MMARKAVQYIYYNVLIILLSNVIWLIYAFNKNDMAIIYANLFVGSCALTILYFKLKYK